jgi:predicted transcriptional regulator
MKTRIFEDGFEGHRRRSLARVAKIEAGERPEPERVITFADPADMLACLSAQRVRLCQTVRRKRLSISALALELGRNRGAVTRDVNQLMRLGLVRLREQTNPGHGVVQIVEPIAERIEMRVAI